MSQQILLFFLCCCLIIQAGYYLYYFIPFLSYTPPALEKVDFPVSVVLAAHNEANNLKRLLPCLLTQQYPLFEVLVADDRSTDETKKKLQELRQNHPNLRILPIEKTPPGIHPKKYALSQAIAQARYEHVLLTDADCLPASENWIKEMAQGFFGETAIVLGYSPYIRIFGFLNKLIRYETLLTALQYFSFARRGHAYMGVGRNLAYTKTSFNQVNGFASFRQVTGGDDDLLVQQARRKGQVNLVISPDSHAASFPKQTYGEWFIQKRRHLSVGRHYYWADQVRIGLFMGANLGFYLAVAYYLLIFNELFLPLILLIGRSIVLMWVYGQAARKLKEKLPVFLLPLLDILYFINYLILGVSVVMFKKVRWK